jgi:succinate dehydrogenase / fumarate reductase flavoprotein subunit
LGANSTGECLVWGKITGELAAKYALSNKNSSNNIPNAQVLDEEKRIYDGIFRGRGQINPYEVRKQLSETMDAKAHVYRKESDLSDGLRIIKELQRSSWKHVDDQAKEYNTNFTNVMELDSMLRIAEIILIGALNRLESRGAQARIEYPKRDDVRFLKHTIAYYTGSLENPKMDWSPVTITRFTPVERHY